MTQQNNSLAVIMPDEWRVLMQQAEVLVASGFLPQSVNSVQKAVAIMTLGRELGIGAWAALNGINVIQGKPTVSPQLMLAMINGKGVMDDMTITDDGESCTVIMKRKGRSPHSYTFSDTDAGALNLLQKDNWRKQKKIMRQWRAVAGCARIVFPDVILNLYTPDEMGADVTADDQGNMTVIDTRPELASKNNGHEPDSVRVEQPSAKVVGVQPQRPTPPTASVAVNPAPSDASDDPLADFGMEQGATVIIPQRPDDDPDLYRCNRLKVNKTKTATQYILFVEHSATRIPVTDVIRFEGLTINGVPIIELPASEYPLEPAWSVHADSDGKGWQVSSIETEMAF